MHVCVNCALPLQQVCLRSAHQKPYAAVPERPHTTKWSFMLASCLHAFIRALAGCSTLLRQAGRVGQPASTSLHRAPPIFVITPPLAPQRRKPYPAVLRKFQVRAGGAVVQRAGM
eukprot:1159745-Pelagomonas_calceolata.AAC.7